MSDTAPTTPSAPTNETASTTPRLAPIEEPASWTTRLAYTLARWQQGTVVTRFLLGVAEQVPDGFEVSLVRVNGRPGLLATVDGAPQSVWSFHIQNGRIQNACAVLNPDKLRHVDPPGNSTRRAYDSLPGL